MGAAFLLVAFVRAGRLALEWASLEEEVSAQTEARSALRALSATLSRPGGPNNAAKLNGLSRWALPDVREAKNSAALTPSPDVFFRSIQSMLGGSAKNRQRFCSVLLTP